MIRQMGSVNLATNRKARMNSCGIADPEALRRENPGSETLLMTVPKRLIGWVPSDVWAATVIANDWSTRASSSIAIA